MFRRVLALALTAGLLFGGTAPTFASEPSDSPVSLLGKGGKGKAGKKGKGKKGKKGKKKGSKKPAGKGKKVSTATAA